MKRIILLLIVFGAILFSANSQPQQNLKAKLGENSVVKDSTGAAYPYSVWSKLLGTGYYIIKAVNAADEKSEFLLIRLTEEQRQQRLERVAKPAESKYFKTGEEISSFKTTDINGNKINLKDLKGKVVVINFWFINCPPCRQEIPELNRLVSDYQDSSNVVFIAVALDEKRSLKDFLEKNPFNYTIIDNGRFISDKYGVKSYPTNLVIDKEGKVFYHSSGYSFVTAHWIRKSIKELLEKS